MKLDIFTNTSPNATADDAIGARLHDRGTGKTVYGATEADAIENLCKYVDRDQVNALLQKDDRQSTAYAQSGSYPTLGEIGVVAIIAEMFAIVGGLQ